MFVHWFFHGLAVAVVAGLIFMALRQRKHLLFDRLTGIYSRFAFEDQWPAAVAAVKRSDRYIGLLYIDGDGMKKTNDSQGHAAGDLFIKRLARAVASALTETVRFSDTVYRWGGDEFVVILAAPNGVLGMRRVIDRIIVAMNEYGVVASVGWIVISPDDFIGNIARNQIEEMAANALSKADTNMRKAKERKDGLASHVFPE